MQSLIISLVLSIIQRPEFQSLILTEVGKIPGVGGVLSELINMLTQHTSPTPTQKTITAGPSQGVKDLQISLNAAGAMPPLKVDGYFGPKTLAAIKAEAAKLGVPL